MYHDSNRSGFFSLLVDVRGEKRQSSHRLADMPAILNLVDKTRDTWMSQAEFIRPNRRVVNLARLGLLFTDLDTYRVRLSPVARLTNWRCRCCISALKKDCQHRPY